MDRRSAEQAAMTRALALAASPGVPLGPNPRVGCVLLAEDGTTVAEGFHRGAGAPHAEAEALARAGSAARGTTAVVTLEPCNHTGRTGPCARALAEAGVARVVYAQADTNPVATGGADALRVDHTGDPRVGERPGARSGAAGVVAGLEGDDGRRTPGGGAGTSQGVRLRVRRPGTAVEALRDGRAVLGQQHAADPRVRAERDPGRRGQGEGARHRGLLG